jgi:hypothetical protein
MGIFKTFFKKKEKLSESINNNILTEEADGVDDVSPIVIDQSNVLEQMQNNFAEEVAKEEEAATAVEKEPMSVFNQNISLDTDNPMSIFGVDGSNKDS